MMGRFSLKKAIDFFQQSAEDREGQFIYYYDTKAEDFFSIESYYVNELLEDEVPENLLDWQKEAYQEAEAYLDNEHKIFLPSSFEINPYSFMENFVWHTGDEDLARAIHGRGAFRRFREELYRKRLTDRWYDFEQEEYAKEVRDWAKWNQLDYEEDLNTNKK